MSLLCVFSINNVFASEISYDNLITDESSIEEDFEILNMDLSNYYLTKEVINKSYIIAYSESLLENNIIQSYIYLYLSYDTRENLLENYEFTYTLNDIEYTFNNGIELQNIGNYLYKIKGFTYEYIKDVEIGIKLNEMYKIIQESNYAYKKVLLPESKVFNVSVSHSLLSDNKPFEMELAFDSVLIIDEMFVQPVNVEPEFWETENFGSAWKEFWDYKEKDLVLHFYNFNFPDNINPDSIEYAKFEYDVVEYQYIYYAFEDSKKTEIKRDVDVLKEYAPKSNKFITDNNTLEMSFETFVLGNRILQGEFPDYIEFTDDMVSNFNYDCSILLDSTIETKVGGLTSTTVNKIELEYVDFLELHYKKNGILYKCQVIGETIEKEDPTYDDKDDLNDDLFDKLISWFKNLWETNKGAIFGFIAIIVGIICLVSLAPHFLAWIVKGIVWFIKTIIKGIIWLIKLPFKLIKWLFGGLSKNRYYKRYK